MMNVSPSMCLRVATAAWRALVVSIVVLSCVAAVLSSPETPSLFETASVFVVTPANRPNYRISALLQAPNGDLLVFVEKRNDGIGDIGNHDIVLKRSRDRGRTWSAEQIIFDDADRPCADMTVGLDHTTGKIWLFFLRDKKEFAYFTSGDNGASWQGPVSIHEQVTRPEWDQPTPAFRQDRC
jgi:sialidase-1